MTLDLRRGWGPRERLFYGGQHLWQLGREAWAAWPALPGSCRPSLPAFMLFGFAFENALKGLIAQLVREGQKVRTDDGS